MFITLGLILNLGVNMHTLFSKLARLAIVSKNVICAETLYLIKQLSKLTPNFVYRL